MERVEGSTAAPGPDLADLDCIVVGTSAGADDLRVYLAHGGARVQMAGDLAAAARCAIGLRRPVVIHSAWRDEASPQTLSSAFVALPDVRHVLISRGRRLGTRMAAANVTTLDGHCLRRASLLRAVAVAAGRASPEVLHEIAGEDFAAGRGQPATIAEARAQGRLILIAEDDAVNQKVILRQIEMLGFAAEVADNGAEALRLWLAGDYALLLTDLHMPDLDGYGLAEAIRAQEAVRGVASEGRMPILAVTANALRGEATRARAAGMDEYLTKPLQLHQLKTALRKWLPRDRLDTLPAELDEAPDVATAGPALDVAVLKALIGDDPAVVHDFLVEYRTQARRLAIDLRSAHDADDIREIGAIAHKLKSSSRAVGALKLGDLCAGLENACRSGSLEQISRSMQPVRVAWLAVEVQIANL
jgi:CheY-like chemotaxis protein